MQYKNILVTGGAGFIGSHLTDALLSLGHKVFVLDDLVNGSLENLKDASNHSNFTFIEGSILNVDLLDKIMPGINVVYHLACLGVRHSLHSPIENHLVNADGTIRVLEASKNHKVDYFYYISSSEIYGKVQEFPIKETSLPDPLTVYGASKLVGELYTKAYTECFGLKTTVLRIFNNYGPRAHYEGDAGEIIPRTIVKLIYNQQPIIFGDGLITRDFFFVKDTAQALINLMNFDNLVGKTLNIGTGVEITMKHLVETIIKLMKKEDVGIRFEDDRPADVPRLWVDSTIFKSTTGFESKYSFEEGLQEAIDFYIELSKSKNLLDGIIEKNWETKTTIKA